MTELFRQCLREAEEEFYRMPTKAPTLGSEGRIGRRRERVREYSKANYAERSFYWSTQWRRLRKMKLNQDPVCEECLKSDVVEPATEVDHIIPRAKRPDLELDMTNLQSLCKPHHSSKTATENAPGRNRSEAQAR